MKMLNLFLILLIFTFLFPLYAIADLKWRDQNLESMGLYKGSGLPLHPGLFWTYTYHNGGKQLPAGIEPNTIMGVSITNFYTAEKLKDSSGNKIDGEHELSSVTEFARFIYFYPIQPSNPKLRLFFDFLLPVSTIHSDADMEGPNGEMYPNGAGAGGGGFGDIIVLPVALLYAGLGNENIQISGFVFPAITFPTGEYDKYDFFNEGSNVYTFNIVWENYINFPKIGNYGGLQFHSWLNYVTSTHNKDFVLGGDKSLNMQVFGREESTYNYGDIFLMNFDINYPVTETLALGINFNFLFQLQNDKIDGYKISGSKEKAISLGPNIYYQKGPLNIGFKSSIEVETENRFKGVNNWLLISYAF